MGKLAERILKEIDSEYKVTFQQIQQLYKDKAVREVDFTSDGKELVLTRVVLANGESVIEKTL